jgi:hypothetical protein
MGFLDKLLGRKPADEPQTAPPPASMPEGDTGGTTEPSDAEGESGEHEHSHEGEHGHEH